jgi:hypothetical protein
MPEYDLAVREAILHSIKVLSRWTIILFLSLVLVTSLGFYDALQRRAALARVADQTLSALCTFRADLQQRYDDGVQFLEDNPDGIPGFSAAAIRHALSNQRRTLTSLAGLPCHAKAEDP